MTINGVLAERFDGLWANELQLVTDDANVINAH
jgi:hypothetical protein